MFYAGIGSRETPEPIEALMMEIGARMARSGWTLRSGGAEGADRAFEIGCDSVDGKKEIFLPWRGFNRSKSEYYRPTREAYEMAREFHPAWEHCSTGARHLHARNMHQILGLDLATPVNLVICWTPEGKGGGGTGQAIRLARYHNIKVHDLALSNIRSAYEARL